MEFDSNGKTLIAGACPRCGASEVYRDNTKVLTSNPAQNRYECKACGKVWSAHSDREAVHPAFSCSALINDYFGAQTGWICPKCGKVLAPWMSECDCYLKTTAPAGTKTETGTVPSTGGNIAISTKDSATSTATINCEGIYELRG